MSEYNEQYFLGGGQSNYGNKWSPYIKKYKMKHFRVIAGDLVKKYNIKKVLDVGCARGYLVYAFQELGVDAYGIDISKWAITNADPEVPKEKLILGDATDLSMFKRNEFDYVTCIDLLEHLTVDEAKKCIKEMCRVSKKGILTYICINDNSKDPTHKTIMEGYRWVDMFHDNEWKVIIENRYRQVDLNVSLRMEIVPRTTRRYKDIDLIILMPVHDAETSLELCLEFISRLDPKPTKVIFCENNSTDRTVEIINNYKGSKEIIQFNVKRDFLYGKHTHTVIAMARQKLLERARELSPDYAMYVDSDILLLQRDTIQRIHDRELDFMGIPYYRHFVGGIFLSSLTVKDGKIREHTYLETDLFRPYAISGGTMILSRSAIQDTRLHFYPIHNIVAANMSEDFSFCVLARSQKYEIYLDKRIYVNHIIPASMRAKAWAYGPTSEGYKLIEYKYKNETTE